METNIRFRMARMWLLLLVAIPSPTLTQTAEVNPRWDFLPARGEAITLTANPTEPRLGLQKEIGSSRMQLDIGASLDLLGLTLSEGSEIRLGVSLFSYALTTNSEGLHLQIDAVDGFFGGYLSTAHRIGGSRLLVRFRFIHHSAHFVDGHIDPATGTWKDDREPVPYTKDFGELVAGLDWQWSGSVFRIYSGISYSTKVRPPVLKRFESLHGVEWGTNDNFAQIFGKPFNLYAAYNLGIAGSPVYVGTNHVELGGKFAGRRTAGLRVFGAYHGGLDIFGQYYDVRVSLWKLGFALDL